MAKEHQISVGAAKLWPDLSGAAFWPEEKALLVADLHLEHGTSLARRGLHVPPYDTDATLSQLEEVLKATAAKRLFLLGDSFHHKAAHSDIAPDVQQRLMALTTHIDTIWISGNHDPLPPLGLGGTSVDEVNISGLHLRHIPGVAAPEIAGHLHPGASLVQRGRHIHGKCFVSDGTRLILPAFGSYTGAMSLRNPAFDGLFDVEKAKVWLIGRNAIHRLAWGRVA